MKAENINKNNVLTRKLIYTSRKIDLNGDGQKEYVVWVPTTDLGGTSGYPFIVFARTKKGFRVLFEEGAWTPLIVMNSKKNRWRDVAFQTGGGGEAWKYNIIQFNGKSYELQRTQKQPPKGQIIIERDWENTTFGPIP